MKKILILVNHDVVIYNFRKELVWELLAEDMKFIFLRRRENVLRCSRNEV